MKKIFICMMCATAALIFFACGKKEDPYQKWEYKEVKTERVYYESISEMKKYAPFWCSTFEEFGDSLNSLGQEGWELVDVYTTVETVFPNFGNEKYVTGIRTNTRTYQVVYVFKRPYHENKDKDKEMKNSNTNPNDTTVEVVEALEAVDEPVN